MQVCPQNGQFVDSQIGRERKGRQIGGQRCKSLLKNYVNPSIPKDKAFWVMFFLKKDAGPARWGPPDGWEPPGARSGKVGSLKKKRMETLKRGPH